MKKLNGTVIVTYRCNARCNMCNRYKKPSQPEEEISLETIKKLPPMYFTNITGGEPFIRTDLKEIVSELRKKVTELSFLPTAFLQTGSWSCAGNFRILGSAFLLKGWKRPIIRSGGWRMALTEATPH